MAIATSGHFADGYYAIRNVWSFRDLVEAHIALDALLEIQDMARPPPPKSVR